MSNKTDIRSFSGNGVTKKIDTVGGNNTKTDNWTLEVHATDHRDHILIKAKPKDYTDWNPGQKRDSDMLERVYIDLGGGDDYYDSRPIQGEWATNDFEEIVNAGTGNDEIHTANLTHSAGAKVYGGAGADKIYGGQHADTIYGDSHLSNTSKYNSIAVLDDWRSNVKYDDYIVAGDGNDKVYGEYGNDIISGGRGNDTIDGGDGNDVIFGGDGGDSITAGAGDDYIDVGLRFHNKDNVWTGSGHDIVNLGTMVAYTVDGEPIGIDYNKIYLDSLAYAATLTAKTFAKEYMADGTFGIFSTMVAASVKTVIAIVRATHDADVAPVVTKDYEDFVTVHDFDILNDRAVYATVPGDQGSFGGLQITADEANAQLVLEADQNKNGTGGVLAYLKVDQASAEDFRSKELLYTGNSEELKTIKNIMLHTLEITTTIIEKASPTVANDHVTYQLNGIELTDADLARESPDSKYNTMKDYLDDMVAEGQTAYFFGGGRSLYGADLGDTLGLLHLIGTNESDIIYASSPTRELGTGTTTAAHLFGFDGDDILVGSNGDDFLIGGRGQDLLVGGGAGTGTGALHQNQTDKDTFVFDGDDQKDVGDAARDTIVGFDLAHDAIRLTGYGNIAKSDISVSFIELQDTDWESADYENVRNIYDAIIRVKTDNGEYKEIVLQDIMTMGPKDIENGVQQHIDSIRAEILDTIEVLTSVDSSGVGHWDSLFA